MAAPRPGNPARVLSLRISGRVSAINSASDADRALFLSPDLPGMSHWPFPDANPIYLQHPCKCLTSFGKPDVH